MINPLRKMKTTTPTSQSFTPEELAVRRDNRADRQLIVDELQKRPVTDWQRRFHDLASGLLGLHSNSTRNVDGFDRHLSTILGGTADLLLKTSRAYEFTATVDHGSDEHKQLGVELSITRKLAFCGLDVLQKSFSSAGLENADGADYVESLSRLLKGLPPKELSDLEKAKLGGVHKVISQKCPALASLFGQQNANKTGVAGIIRLQPDAAAEGQSGTAGETPLHMAG